MRPECILRHDLKEEITSEAGLLKNFFLSFQTSCVSRFLSHVLID